MIVALMRILGFDVGIIVVKTKGVAMYSDARGQLCGKSGLASFGGVLNSPHIAGA
jgi:hypothetical protein